MWGHQNLGSWSRKTSHSSGLICNEGDESSEEEGMEVSPEEESFGHRYLDTRHYLSINHVGH